MAGKNHAIAESRSTRDSHLGGQGTASTGLHPVADLHEVIDLCSCSNAGLSHRRTVDGAAAPHFHPFFQHHKPGLGHFSPPFGSGNKAKPFRTHDCGGVDHAAAMQAAAGMQDGVGVNHAMVSDLHIAVDHDAGMNHAVCPDAAAIGDADVSSDRDASPQFNAITDHRAGMNRGHGSRVRMQVFEGFGKGQAWITQNSPGETSSFCELA